MNELKGKLVVVTGASRGIGAATAQLMASKGAHVLLLARTAKDLDIQVAAIEKAGGKATSYPADLSDHAQVTATAAKILQEQGTPDILINNAGLGRWLFTHETPPEEAQLMVHLPYLAAFWLTGALLPAMFKKGSGRIVNVNSPSSILAWGGATAYTSSRWALRGFSESLKVDLLGTGVTVCHCVFGETTSNYFIDNPGSHERLPKIAKIIPVSSPEQIAEWLVKAATSRRKEMTKPFFLRLIRMFHGIAPGIVKWAVRSTSYRMPKQ